MILFPFLECITGGTSTCGPKLEVVGEGSTTFKGIGLSVGSSMVTSLLLLDKVGKASYPEDLLHFSSLKSSSLMRKV